MPLKIWALYPCACWPHPLMGAMGRGQKNWQPARPSHGPDGSAKQDPKASGLRWRCCIPIFDSIIKGTAHCRIKSAPFTRITPLFSYCSSLPGSKPYSIPLFSIVIHQIALSSRGKIKSIYFSTTSSISFTLLPASSILLPRRVLQQLATTEQGQGHLVCCVTELLVQRLQSSAQLRYGQGHGNRVRAPCNEIAVQ